MNHQTLQSIKFKKLMMLTGEGKRATIGLLQGIWLFAQANCPRGDIGRVSNEDIALDLDIPQGEIDGLIAALVKAGWLDEHSEHRLVIHDWHDHCERSTHALLARNRQTFASGEQPRLSALDKRYRRSAEAHYGGEAPVEDQTAIERGGGSGSAPTPYTKIVELWNDMASQAGLPQVQQITDKRKAAMRTRYADENWRKLYKAALPMIPGSDRRPGLLTKLHRQRSLRQPKTMISRCDGRCAKAMACSRCTL